MGYRVKIQKVDRPKSRSFYVNLPVVLADTLPIDKGEEFEWSVEDKDTLILRRLRTRKPKKTKK